jgi:DNA-directed RNA polymerase specialized sigma24 family protein
MISEQTAAELLNWSRARAWAILPPSEVDDAAASAVEKALAVSKRLGGERGSWPYLQTVARYAVVAYAQNFYTKRDREEALAPEHDYALPSAEAETLQEAPEPLSERALALLEVLTPREREVVTETILKGRSAADVGREFGFAESSARAVKSTALRKMREAA